MNKQLTTILGGDPDAKPDFELVHKYEIKKSWIESNHKETIGTPSEAVKGAYCIILYDTKETREIEDYDLIKYQGDIYQVRIADTCYRKDGNKTTFYRRLYIVKVS